MASRALPDLIARVRLDSTGVDSAVGNLIGTFGKANLAMAGVAAGLGLIVVGGKSFIDISEAMQHANGNLKAAVDSYNLALGTSTSTVIDAAKHAAELEKAQSAQVTTQDALLISHNGLTTAQLAYTDAVKKHGASSQEALKASLALQDAQIRYNEALTSAKQATDALTKAQQVQDQVITGATQSLEKVTKAANAFIAANRENISSQAEVLNGFASFIREGETLEATQKAMTLAMNIAAVENISLADAVDKVQGVEAGRAIGLKRLVGVTLEAIPASATLAEKQAIIAHNMDIASASFDHGTDSLTSTQKATNKLSNDWQDLAQRGGPPLIGMMDAVIDRADKIYGGLDALGKNDAWWHNLNNGLVTIAQDMATISSWVDVINGKDLGKLIQTVNGVDTNYPGPTGQGRGGRAGGGPVLPNSVYRIGEQGPETLVMGQQGGYVLPNASASTAGGGVTQHFVINAAGMDVGELAAEVAWRQRFLH